MATVIFKPTESCNANCVYCISRTSRRGAEVMPARTLELLFVRINEFLQERPREQLELIWHGGEPFLLGRTYFEDAVRFQRRHCGATNERIHHTLQSNLTLFRKEYVGVLRDLGMRTLGTSYDPLNGLRGLGPARDSMAYNRAFMRGLRILQEEGFDWGLVYVVTRRSLDNPVQVLRFLANLAPSRGFIFNPVITREGERDELAITPREFGEFLRAVFPVWWQHRDFWPDVEPLTSLVRHLSGGRAPLVCVDSGRCADTHISLLPDGTMSHCGRSADLGVLSYGSIEERTFASVFADGQREAIRERNRVLLESECRDCPYWALCHGGCPLESWTEGGTFLHRTPGCEPKRELIEQVILPALKNTGCLPGMQGTTPGGGS